MMEEKQFIKMLDKRLSESCGQVYKQTPELPEEVRKDSWYAWTDSALDDCMHLISHSQWDK